MDYNKEIDYSSLKTFIDCRRKFFYQYILHLRSESPSIHLIFGSAWHYGLEVVYNIMKEDPKALKLAIDCREISTKAFTNYWKVEGEEHFGHLDTYPKNPGNASNMYNSYWNKFFIMDRSMTVFGVEMPFTLLLKSGVSYIGRMDLVMKEFDKIFVIDHKTSSIISKITASEYEASLQTKGYLTAIQAHVDTLPRIIYRTARCQKGSTETEQFEVFINKAMNERFLQDVNWWSEQVKNEVAAYNAYMLDYHATGKPVDFRSYFPAFHGSYSASCTAFFSLCPYYDICAEANNPLHYAEHAPTGYKFEEWNPADHEAKITKKLKEIT